MGINHLKSRPTSLVDLTEVKSIDFEFSTKSFARNTPRIMGRFYHIADINVKSIEKLTICHKTNGNEHVKLG